VTHHCFRRPYRSIACCSRPLDDFFLLERVQTGSVSRAFCRLVGSGAEDVGADSAPRWTGAEELQWNEFALAQLTSQAATVPGSVRPIEGLYGYVLWGRTVRSGGEAPLCDRQEEEEALLMPDYRYEVRRGDELVVTGHLSRQQPLEVGERITIGGQTGIVRSVEPTLGSHELLLVIQRLRDHTSG
jgi:hypothetical protein